MKRLLSIFTLIAALILAGPVLHAEATVQKLESFGAIPVLEGGRVMPMDSLARNRLLQFSGKSTVKGEAAIGWLARLLFTPENAHDDAIFMVNHPEVMEAMGLTTPDVRFFSFNTLQPGMAKLQELYRKASEVQGDKRTPVEKEILRVYQNLNLYMQMFHGFNFALPSEDFTVTHATVRATLQLGPEHTALSFLDVYLRMPAAAGQVEALTRKPQSGWTEDERELFELSSRLFQWGQFYRGLPPPILPIQGHGEEQWISPWDALGMGFGNDTIRAELQSLQDLVTAYRAGRQVEFDMAAHSFTRSTAPRAAESRGTHYLGLELLYNKIDPFYRAELLYGLSFLIALGTLLKGSGKLRLAALVLAILAFIPHTWGLVARMLIMGRPPVTNLYATFIFVAWICVALGLVLEWFQRNSLGTIMAGISGLALLLVSGKFAEQGDTMGVMIAVLDSNFWLATHVVTITIGYAGCIAAGLAGHIYMIKAIRTASDAPELQNASRAVYGLLAFGLIFSFLGTMLGGVWADQSWGRFWGWDPKENGALLIVLWCSVLFHARIAKLIGPLGLAAGSVLGVIIVLMAWLGVNLLGVGLHSYGFTSGIARGFWLSALAEVLFVAITYPLARRKAVARLCDQ